MGIVLFNSMIIFLTHDKDIDIHSNDNTRIEMLTTYCLRSSSRPLLTSSQTHLTKPTKQKLLVKAVNALVRSAFGNVFIVVF